MKATTLRSTSTAHRDHNSSVAKGLMLFILFLLVTLYSFSQSAAYLDFRNPVVESGVAGADGATYRFSNVTTNVDALVTIMGRSDALVNILNPDMNTSGFDGAFQPQVGYNNGTTPGAADWWMQFNISFVEHGTNNSIVIPEFNVSGVDIDGNSQYINEYLSFFDMAEYSIESGSGLAVTSLYENIEGAMYSGRRFDGPVANYTNIDTSATSVMVTNRYVDKSSFIVRTGGKSSDVSGAADRMYSFYFQNFTYNAPANSLLSINPARVRPTRSNELQTIVSVYPNPVRSELKITIPVKWQNKEVSFEIFSLNGVAVKKEINKHASQATTLQLDHLQAGNYVIRMRANDETVVQMIAKQ